VRTARRALVVVGVLCLVLAPGCGRRGTTISVSGDDPEMNAAMQKARSQVSSFLDRLRQPKTTDRHFSVKVPLRDGERVEHFWLEDVRYENGMFRGTLGNDPEVVRGHKFGEPVEVAADGISDWMYVDGDHLVGGFTIRVLRDRMSPAERAELDHRLDFKID
jgi:uncharacterized protein YegJ (DUF2314 family)